MRRRLPAPNYGFQTLFILMILGLVATSFLYYHPFIHIFGNIFFTLIFMVAIYSLKGQKFNFYLTLILALITGLFSWVYLKAPHPALLLMEEGMRVVFFGYLTVLFSVQVFSHEDVTSETIFGALCVYFLLAFFWAFVYSFLDTLNPNSFDLEHRPQDFSSYLYFSLVTLSTLGYGDITPRIPAAQSLACLEAVLGQLYLVVVVARFVGIEIASKGAKRAKPD